MEPAPDDPLVPQSTATDQPGSDAEVSQPPAIDPDREAARNAFVNPSPRKPMSAGWYVVGLVAFIVAWGGSSVRSLAVLMGVLLFHELGHVAAMAATGHRDLRILFIPFLGAVATGRATRASTPVEQAIVLLAGPIPGLAVALALHVALHPAMGSALAGVLNMLAVVNLFNLLPIVPLDGGRFLEVVALSRWRHVANAARFLSVVALAGLAYALQSPGLAVIAFFIVPGLLVASRIAAEAARIRPRFPSFPAPGAALSGDQMTALFEGARSIVPPSAKDLAARRAYVMWELNVALGRPPASARASLALFVVFIAAWGVGLSTLAVRVVPAPPAPSTQAQAATDTPVTPIARAVMRIAARRDALGEAALRPEEHMIEAVLLLLQLRGDVAEFLGSVEGDTPRWALRGLREVGAASEADALETLCRLFPGGWPPEDREARVHAIEALTSQHAWDQEAQGRVVAGAVDIRARLTQWIVATGLDDAAQPSRD